jgi:hypothetical protein
MAYLLNPEFGRELKSGWVRDGGAFAEISALLNERGYRFGRTFLNSPPDIDEIETYRKTLEGPQLLSTSLDFLHPGQLLVITSRLPTSDWPYPPKVYMMRGWTELEQAVFQVLGPFVPECRRDFVRLETDLVRHLEPAYRDRAAVRFRLKRPAPYYTLLSGVGGPRRYPRGDERTRTAVYLLYLDEVEELNGAGLLALWGMGANESYAWAHLVRTKFSHLLDRPNFTMAELTVPELPKRPTGIEFVESWPIEVILHYEL